MLILLSPPLLVGIIVYPSYLGSILGAALPPARFRLPPANVAPGVSCSFSCIVDVVWFAAYRFDNLLLEVCLFNKIIIYIFYYYDFS